MATSDDAATGGRVWAHWTASWIGAVGLRAANQRLRRATLDKRMSELRAHQLSTALHVLALGQRFVHLQRRTPIRRTGTALAIGTTWVTLTVGLDYALGHYVSHKSWDELIRDYDVRQGRVWPLALVWMLVGPEVVRRLVPADGEAES